MLEIDSDQVRVEEFNVMEKVSSKSVGSCSLERVVSVLKFLCTNYEK